MRLRAKLLLLAGVVALPAIVAPAVAGAETSSPGDGN